MPDTIALRDLQVGMYVHLDLGWMSHPFPRSSFHIASAEQISTLRSLGLSHVRWAPERSLAGAVPAAGPLPAGLPLRPCIAVAPAVTGTVTLPASRAVGNARGATAETAPRFEQDHARAGRAVGQVLGAIAADPQGARAGAESLAGTLLAGMMVDEELSIRLLSAPLDDPHAAHALNVAVISLLLGRLLGLENAEMIDLGVGAILHDAGRIDLPERLRRPDDGFSAAEHEAYRGHVGLGVAHGRRMQLSPGALLVLAQHHENADGSGFPLKLVTDRMSVPARIVALVDRFDMLCNPAPRARALTPHEALSLMFAQCRTQYDTTMLNAFIRMVGVYPAGSVVQLTDDRFALVVGVNSSRPLKPRVLVHDPAAPRDGAQQLNLELATDLGIRRGVQRQALPPSTLAFLAPPPRIGYFFEPPLPATVDDEALALV